MGESRERVSEGVDARAGRWADEAAESGFNPNAPTRRDGDAVLEADRYWLALQWIEEHASVATTEMNPGVIRARLVEVSTVAREALAALDGAGGRQDEERALPEGADVDFGERRPGSSSPMPPERRAKYEQRIKNAQSPGIRRTP